MEEQSNTDVGGGGVSLRSQSVQEFASGDDSVRDTCPVSGVLLYKSRWRDGSVVTGDMKTPRRGAYREAETGSADRREDRDEGEALAWRGDGTGVES